MKVWAHWRWFEGWIDMAVKQAVRVRWRFVAVHTQLSQTLTRFVKLPLHMGSGKRIHAATRVGCLHVLDWWHLNNVANCKRLTYLSRSLFPRRVVPNHHKHFALIMTDAWCMMCDPLRFRSSSLCQLAKSSPRIQSVWQVEILFLERPICHPPRQHERCRYYETSASGASVSLPPCF